MTIYNVDVVIVDDADDDENYVVVVVAIVCSGGDSNTAYKYSWDAAGNLLHSNEVEYINNISGSYVIKHEIKD